MSDDSVSESVEEFAVPLGRGMRRRTEGEKTTFRQEEAASLRAQLGEFEAVRTRGDVESRTAHLGGRAPR